MYNALYALLFLAFVLVANGSIFLCCDGGFLPFSTPSQFQARLSVNRAFVCAVVYGFVDTGVPNRDRRDCIWAGWWDTRSGFSGHSVASWDLYAPLAVFSHHSTVTVLQWRRKISYLRHTDVTYFLCAAISKTKPSFLSIKCFFFECFCSQLLAWTQVHGAETYLNSW
jgi:hypothetical protein